MTHLFGILIAACLLIVGLAWFTEASNQRVVAEAQAQAILINANASANATLMTAALPLTLVILAGLVILVLAIGWMMKQRNKDQKIIERQVIYVLPAGATMRRDVWQALSDSRPDLLELSAGKVEVKR